MPFGDAFLESCERNKGAQMEVILKSGVRLLGSVGHIVTLDRSALVGANNINVDEVAAYTITPR